MPLSRILLSTIALLAPERRLAVTLALANVALAAAAFAEPVLFGMIVDRLARAQAEADPAAALAGLGPLLAAWVGFGLFTIAAGVLVALHADRLAHRGRLAAMAEVFEHALALPLAFHAGTHSGRALKVMIEGAGALFALWLSFLRDQAAALVAVAVLLPLTLFLNWRLGLVLVVLVLASGLLTHAVLRRTERMQGTVEGHHTALAGNASDALGNVAVVQSFTRIDAEVRHMRAVMADLLAAQAPVLSWWALASVATRCAGTLTVLAILLLGIALFREGLATIGEIVSFVALATMLIGRLEQLVFFVNGLLLNAPKIAELFAVRDTIPAVAERPGARDPGRLAGAVAFEGVSYSYDGERAAVRELTFSVAPGETVALVGETGSGKSTALALLHRAFDPDTGRVLLDGVDARDWQLEGLRRNIGVVFQEPMLFARSLRENLLVGKPDARDDELVAALERAQAGGFLARLPRGLDTEIGERGRSLSGGERQRIAVARALLKDPPILVLDEATSALDAVTEARLKEALAEAMRGRTVFVIAHRLATVRDADRILVLHEGRIVEDGSYEGLLAAGGRFARLAASQHLLQRLEADPAL
ncbi:glucan ABC transporter ATP-binding protein/ permease [Salinarimonas rosea]|uniref:glucan ABC transporter ATP-binding protein/ permease n=1 Tax=Salinarimonas rosea TaxID=552063 RepID=UPI00041B0A0F|nr:glucan ABC transporter ATP-binding protein/ permease [Salinarimonas rosea]